MEKHQAECLFKVLKCSNSGCTEMLSGRDKETHEALECSWRKVNCEYCQEPVIKNQRQKHFDICPKVPVLCTNKCGVRDILREKLEVHIRDECPVTEVQCEYKNLGCEAVIPRSNANIHSETEVKSHLNLALRCLEASEHQVQELVTVVEDQSQQIERQSQQIEEQSQQIEQQSQEIERQSQQIERQSQQIEGQSQQVEGRGQTPFEWKIPNIHETFQQAGVERYIIYSRPFNMFGYYFLLKIEFVLNLWYGFATHKRHGNLYIKVVPGEFDESLSWPCKEKVRVTVIDQDPCQDNRENRSHVIDFGKKPSSRPLFSDNREYTKILDLWDFIYSRSFIRDDTIFITVERE